MLEIKQKKRSRKSCERKQKKDIPRGNYNALTGNEIITENHSSEKKMIAVADVIER